MRTYVFTIAAIGWLGCTDLPPIPEGVCGNNVLEPGEDCDGVTDSSLGAGTACGAPSTAQACQYVCGDESGATCPQGWGCGADGVCRRPSGALDRAPGSPWRFDARFFGIGDVDGDGNADLIGAGSSAIEIRYGTATGEFPTERDIVTRRPTGPPQFVDFDRDGRFDVVMPILTGLFVLLGQSDGTLLPVAYQPLSLEVPALAGFEVQLWPLVARPGEINSDLLVLFGNQMQLGDGMAALPDGWSVGQLAGRLARGDLDVGAASVQHEFAFAFEGANRVYIYEAQDGAAVPRQQVLLPPSYLVDRGALFADVDGRDGLDLLVGARGPTGPTLLVAYNNGAGVLDAFARSESAFDRLTPALPLAAADLNGDGKADYVSGDAVWITDYGLPAVPGPPVALVPLAFRVGDAPWSDAAIGDLNGDARPDVAVAFDGTDGIDVYLGTASGLFNKFHVDTAGPPFALRTGDFDGDLVGDLAFAISGLGAAPDEVAVAFGSPAGGPEPPIVMGQLDFVRILEPMSSVVDLESVDAIADLLVLSDEFPDRDAVSIAILTGNSGRRMLAPFTLQYEDENGDQFDVPSRLAVGDFVPLRDAAGDDHLDIITVAQPQRNLDGTSEVPEPEPADRVFHMWRVPSDGPGAALNALNASFTELPAGAEFEARCGEWTPADLDGDGFHEIVGLDGSWSCYGGVDSPPPSIVVADVAGDLGVTRFGLDVPYRAPDKLAAADLDADGDDDLLVLFRGQARPSAGGNTSDPAEGAAIVVWWNDGGELQLASESSFVVPGAHLLFDVAPARLSGDDDIPELVVLTDAGLFAASLDPDTATYQDLHRLVGEPAEGRLAVGDVDGDGLDDVAFTDGTGDVHVYLGRAAPPLGGVVGDAVAVPDQGGAP